jgi:glycosyltransferase involved in cell wall biosynthesis
MRIAMLSPIAWRTPPRHYGPWESVVSLLTEGLVERGHDVTLFATGDSLTSGTLRSVCAQGYEEDNTIIPKVAEALHITNLFEHGDEFDVIHNHFDFLPLTYTGLTKTPVVTTIHGFSSPGILPVYEKYNKRVAYVSISDSDRAPQLDYVRTIYHGIDLDQFDFQSQTDDYLLFFGRIHPDKGAKEAIEIAKRSNKKLIMAGIIQDHSYFQRHIHAQIDSRRIIYKGSVGPVERNQLLGKAAALLHPINFDEPFGLSVVEAMACGTPVIAFKRGSMPEIIDDGKNGFLVADVHEAVDLVPRLNTLSRSACRRTVEDRFSVERMVDQYCDVYKQIAKKGV